MRCDQFVKAAAESDCRSQGSRLVSIFTALAQAAKFRHEPTKGTTP